MKTQLKVKRMRGMRPKLRYFILFINPFLQRVMLSSMLLSSRWVSSWLCFFGLLYRRRRKLRKLLRNIGSGNLPMKLSQFGWAMMLCFFLVLDICFLSHLGWLHLSFLPFICCMQLRNPKEVSTEEYNEFYKKTFNEYLDPLASSHFTTEVISCAHLDTSLCCHALLSAIYLCWANEGWMLQGEVEFRSILFVPAMSPMGKEDIVNPKTKNIKLYVKRVFISDDFDGELVCISWHYFYFDVYFIVLCM